MSDDSAFSDGSDSDSSDASPVLRGLDTASDEEDDEEDDDKDDDDEKPPEPIMPPFDGGFLRGWHRPTTDRGPTYKFKPMSEADSQPRRQGEALKSDRATPRYLFRLFWDNELLDKIKAATNLHFAKKLKGKPTPLTTAELLRFLALSITMGINRQPQVAHYWRADSFGTCLCSDCVRFRDQCALCAGLGIAGISQVMSRDRFVMIKANIRFATRSEAPHVSKSSGRYDRLFKIRPLLDKLEAVSRDNYRLGRWLTVDEMLVFTKCE